MRVNFILIGSRKCPQTFLLLHNNNKGLRNFFIIKTLLDFPNDYRYQLEYKVTKGHFNNV